MKLTEYHQEQNRKEADANKTMPKATPEEFKRQAELLREARRQREAKTDKTNSTGKT